MVNGESLDAILKKSVPDVPFNSNGSAPTVTAAAAGTNDSNVSTKPSPAKSKQRKTKRKHLGKTKEGNKKKKKEVDVAQDNNGKYANIGSWTIAQWSTVLGKGSANGIDDSILTGELGVSPVSPDELDVPIKTVVPSQVTKRFGTLCFVRRNVFGGNRMKDVWFPAIELSPLHVKGKKKDDLRRRWMCAIDDLNEKLSRKTHESIEENEILYVFQRKLCVYCL